MSSAVDTGTTTVQERSVRATRELCMALGIGPLNLSQTRNLSLAIAEAAAEEVSKNPEFAERVRALFLELVPAKKTRQKSETAGTSARTTKGPKRVELIPISTVDEEELDPYEPPNPFVLKKLYGDGQLRLALDRYGLTALKETLPAMRERFPGTKPKKITKPGIIDYIVEHVAGPGY